MCNVNHHIVALEEDKEIFDVFIATLVRANSNASSPRPEATKRFEVPNMMHIVQTPE